VGEIAEVEMNRASAIGLLIVAIALASAVQVEAAAVLASIYTSPSEAETWSGSSNASCQVLSPTCFDAQFSTIADVYTPLGDGSTSASSGATVKNSSNAQSGFLKLAYDLDDSRSGTYKLRWFTTGSASYTAMINIYVNDTHILPGVNGTIYVSATPGVEPWTEADVSNGTLQILAQNALAPGRNRVIFRLASAGSTAQTITEAYLKKPFGSSDISFVPTGTTQVELDAKAATVWLAVSKYAGVTISGVTCKFQDEANDTQLNLTYNYSVSNPTDAPGKLEVYWVANSSLGVYEGMQLSVYCDLLVEGSAFKNLEQVVYVNRQKGMWVQFSDWFLKMLGLLQQPVKVQVMNTQLADGATTTVVVDVDKGGGVVPTTSVTNCTMTVVDQLSAVLYNNSPMSLFGSGIGMYYLNVNNTLGTPPYFVHAQCIVNDSAGQNVTYGGDSTLNLASISSPLQIYEGIPELTLLSGKKYAGFASQVLVRLRMGSNDVSNAACKLNVFYPNGSKALNNVTMAYFGQEGLYNYTWTPNYTYGDHAATISCVGGSLGGASAKTAGSFVVEDGVVMQSVS
jgi:hypothetical protein